MILTKEIEVAINYKNIEHFKSLGYDIRCSQKINIPIDHISPNSNKKIKVKCDYCGNEKEIKYQSYIKNTQNFTRKYACNTKCAYDKNMETNLIKYGSKHTMQNKEILLKSKNTLLDKYGVDNFSKTNDFRTKYKEIMLEKYGVENIFMNEEIKNKSKETMLSKYGVEYNNQRDVIKEKYLNGDKNIFYIHGKSNPHECNTAEYRRLRRKVLKKFNNQCYICGNRESLICHHLYSRDINKDIIYDINNCMLICDEHHKDFHSKYGYGQNTEEQFNEYLNNIKGSK